MIQLLPFIMTPLKSQQAPKGEVQCVTSEEVASLHKSEPFTFLNSLTAVPTVMFGLQNTDHRAFQRMVGLPSEFVSHSPSERYVFQNFIVRVTRSKMTNLQHFGIPKPMNPFLYIQPRQVWYLQHAHCGPPVGTYFSQAIKLLEPFVHS